MDFKGETWQNEINVRDFILENYTPYDGDESFLEGPTQNTLDLWDEVLHLSKMELEEGGVLAMDTRVVSTITSHGPGYLDKEKETNYGFQTDLPFKRPLHPFGGIRMAEKACLDHGYKVNPEVKDFFTYYRKTHNAGCFDAYSTEMRLTMASRNFCILYVINCNIVELEQDFILSQEVLRYLISHHHNSLEILVDIALLESGTYCFHANLFKFSLWLLGCFYVYLELLQQALSSQSRLIYIIMNIRQSPFTVSILNEVLIKKIF